MALPARPGRAIGDPRPLRASGVLGTAHGRVALRLAVQANASGRRTAAPAGVAPGAATD